MSNRRIDSELVISFDGIYQVVKRTTTEFLAKPHIDDDEIELVLVLAELFLLLCNKWKYSKINRDDKKRIKIAQSEIHHIYFDVFAKLMSNERTFSAEHLQFRLPRTSNKEKAAQLESMGMKDVYVEEDDLAPTHENIYSGFSTFHMALERADKETPISRLRLPRTSNKEKAAQLESMGYVSTLTIDS